MKLYLASSAPGTEDKFNMIRMPRRLLSFYNVLKRGFNDADVFEQIINKNNNRKGKNK